MTEVGARGANGETPVSFYISAGGQAVEASLVVNILGSVDLQEVGGYPVSLENTCDSDREQSLNDDCMSSKNGLIQVVEVRAVSDIVPSDQIPALATSSMPTVGSTYSLLVIVCGAIAAALALAVVIVFVIGCLVVVIQRKRNRDMVEVGLAFLCIFVSSRNE